MLTYGKLFSSTYDANACIGLDNGSPYINRGVIKTNASNAVKASYTFRTLNDVQRAASTGEELMSFWNDSIPEIVVTQEDDKPYEPWGTMEWQPEAIDAGDEWFAYLLSLAGLTTAFHVSHWEDRANFQVTITQLGEYNLEMFFDTLTNATKVSISMRLLRISDGSVAGTSQRSYVFPIRWDDNGYARVDFSRKPEQPNYSSAIMQIDGVAVTAEAIEDSLAAAQATASAYADCLSSAYVAGTTRVGSLIAVLDSYKGNSAIQSLRDKLVGSETVGPEGLMCAINQSLQENAPSIDNDVITGRQVPTSDVSIWNGIWNVVKVVATTVVMAIATLLGGIGMLLAGLVSALGNLFERFATTKGSLGEYSPGRINVCQYPLAEEGALIDLSRFYGASWLTSDSQIVLEDRYAWASDNVDEGYVDSVSTAIQEQVTAMSTDLSTIPVGAILPHDVPDVNTLIGGCHTYGFIYSDDKHCFIQPLMTAFLPDYNAFDVGSLRSQLSVFMDDQGNVAHKVELFPDRSFNVRYQGLNLDDSFLDMHDMSSGDLSSEDTILWCINLNVMSWLSSLSAGSFWLNNELVIPSDQLPERFSTVSSFRDWFRDVQEFSWWQDLSNREKVAVFLAYWIGDVANENISTGEPDFLFDYDSIRDILSTDFVKAAWSNSVSSYRDRGWVQLNWGNRQMVAENLHLCDPCAPARLYRNGAYAGWNYQSASPLAYDVTDFVMGSSWLGDAAILWPNFSKRLVLISTIASVATAAVVATSAFLIKKTMRAKRIIKAQKKSIKAQNAKTAFDQDPTKKNALKYAKAKRKADKANVKAGLTVPFSSNGGDNVNTNSTLGAAVDTYAPTSTSNDSTELIASLITGGVLQDTPM